jgi:hypothetical protein
MRKAIRTSAIVTLLALAGFVAFNVYSIAWDWGASKPDKLTIEACPLSEADAFVAYLGTVSDVIGEARGIVTTASSDAEVAQKYLGLAMSLGESQPPACASLLHTMMVNALENEAYARAALAEGGFFSRIRYQYYHLLSVDNLFLVPFLVRLLEPPIPLPEGMFQTA